MRVFIDGQEQKQKSQQVKRSSQIRIVSSYARVLIKTSPGQERASKGNCSPTAVMRFCLCAVVQSVIKRPSGSGSGCPSLTFYHVLSGTGKGKGKYNSKVISIEETSWICHPGIMCLFCSQGFFFFWKGIKPNIASGAIFCIVCVFAWRIHFPTEVLKGLLEQKLWWQATSLGPAPESS